MLRNNQPFDQDVETVTDAFPGAEIVERPAGEPAVVQTPALIKSKTDFRNLYVELPWIDSGETAALLAMQIATGSAEAAGQDIESQSVRNLKLVNKVHTITGLALADSSMGENAGPDFYARIEAVNADGEIFTYSIGGWIPLGQLRAKYGVILANGWRCQIIATPSRQGNPAYRYVDA